MKLFFATGNQGKIEEMAPKFIEKGHSLEQVKVDVAEIDAFDVEDVARRKVLDSSEAANVDGPMIVEDTGFYVEGIGGFPGSQAAYFAETAGVPKLLKLLEGENDRSAYFKTAIALKIDDEVHVFTGKIRGKVPQNPCGESHPHLPYDSYFIPEHGDKTFAENPELKDENTHRHKAMMNLLEWLENR